MKKFLLAIAIVAFGFTANAQDGELNAGVNLGFPVGDSSDGYSFVIGAEVNYLFPVSDDFKVGPSLGFVNYFGQDVDVPGFGTVSLEDVSFLPIAAAGRFAVSEKFTLGADLGYGIGLSPEGIESGFYYRPMVGYNISEKIMLQATFSGISVTGGSFSNLGVGAMFAL
ncbi:hypothetical protein BTO06_06645 [Tenacibaculum sp. SZ-18]|uniref:outer membrane beta-barrel protein n=1 Tax=Tenacibaculum sp. SZ-18 TaxID=754423 RepID=UPI000CA37FCB|nr:outer membrane beta-barrel protein [Tenacibaculum sp. SZ-18]AUC17033.1 hypothetical protein BTO06_06645 [Tenacibaculum sp. SZ-18]